jgi:hypothetical protein
MDDFDNFLNHMPLSGIFKRRVGLRDSETNPVSGIDLV